LHKSAEPGRPEIKGHPQIERQFFLIVARLVYGVARLGDDFR